MASGVPTGVAVGTEVALGVDDEAGELGGSSTLFLAAMLAASCRILSAPMEADVAVTVRGRVAGVREGCVTGVRGVLVAARESLLRTARTV